MEKIYRNLPELETERLLLRKVEEGDYGDLFECFQDPLVSRFTTWDAHKTIEDSKTLVKFIMKRYADNKPTNWAVVLKTGKKLIGTCGFSSSFPSNKRGEISFALSRGSWGKGYATEVVKKTIEFGFKNIGFNRIEACCDLENGASARVLEKCGMTFEGILREYAFLKGEFRDMKCYAILAKEYKL